jgi:DNA repair exonuclease SbcCD ATPase subunit
MKNKILLFDDNKKNFIEIYSKIKKIILTNKKSYNLSKKSLIKISDTMEFRDKNGNDIIDKKILLNKIIKNKENKQKNKKTLKIINSINYIKCKKLENKIIELKKEIGNNNDKDLYKKMKRFIEVNKINIKIKEEINRLKNILNEKIPISNRLLNDKIIELSKIYDKRKDNIIKNSKKKEANKKIIIFKNKKNKLDEINNKLNIISLYLKLINKQCIPLKLLSEKINGINLYVNDFISDLVDYKCVIKYKEKKLDIYCEKNGIILELNQLSGYERFVLDLSFKRSLNRYSFINRSKMICIDEGWDCIDENNFGKLNLLFKKLRKDFNTVLVITHILNMKEMIKNNHITTKKINNDYSIIINN